MKKQIDVKTSYTAADTVPLKMILDKDLVKSAQKGIILPLHAQFIPTNKCNMNCKFCSCSERDKELEMSLEDAKKIINILKEQGCKAVTITGGGEPLMHPDIDEMIDLFHKKGIKIGFVSNGLLLDKINSKTLNKVTWCRISNGDDRTLNKTYEENLHKAVTNAPDVDWAFSHVVSKSPNSEEIIRIIEFANKHHFTHVRLVSDLFEPEKIDMEELHRQISTEVDTKLVIFQGRKEYRRGGDCYICYLKPLIGPDCKIYACCGVQYALANPSRDLPEELCLGSAFDLKNIIKNSSKPLDGSICVKCYYMNYNGILKSMISNIDHKEFV